MAPTRAHPVVARRPPGNVLAALPLSVLDRARDASTAVLQAGPRGEPRVLRTASRGLTAAAHAVERVPLLRRGEDPTTARG